jgi:crotonobetainyl-CoA:carnitine CoA-transferase CaiB-like acyl-CoA transferase
LTETQRKETLPPLKGLRVLDLTRYVAGPHCTLLLAEFGADVVKIERPKRGEDFRGMQPTWNGESLLFLTLNRNKRSITIDLACEQGRELVVKLAAKADILVENFRPGTMEKLGLSWETLHAINPRLIMARASGFGQSGPYAKRPAYDVIGQALGGLMHMTGSQDGQPTMTGTVVVDYSTALYVTIGVMMALRSRDQTGVGQLVEGSLLGSAVSFLMGFIPEYAMLGHAARRRGNRDKYSVPANSFRTLDEKWIHIQTYTDKQFANLAQGIDRPELANDPSYATYPERFKRVDEVEQLVSQWIEQRSGEEVLQMLENADVPHAPISTIDDVFDDPQVRHCQLITEVEHAGGQKVPVQSTPIKLSETPPLCRGRVPGIGEHTDEVLAEWLQLTEQRIKELRAGNVL